MTEQRHLKNWHRDTPNAPVMPYNNLISNQPMTNKEILKLANKCLDAPNIMRDEWKANEEQLLEFAWEIYRNFCDEK